MMKKYEVVLASRNRGKIRELERLLCEELGDSIVLKSLDDIGFAEEIEENGTTFAENALLKANAVAAKGYITLADDSGLCVEALDGAPGVFSARYAGAHGDDAANNALLLKNLEGKDNRNAAFVAVFATPVAVSSVPMTQEMDGDVILAGQLVVWTTLASAFSVFFVSFLLKAAGVF